MKLLIFDIDGTLTDTNAVDGEFYLCACRDEFGVDAGGTDWATFRHVTDPGIFNELFLRHFARAPLAEEMARQQRGFFARLAAARDNAPGRFREIPGARDFVRYCLEQKSDIGIAFATGGWGTSARMKLSAAGIAHETAPLSSADGFIRRHDILTHAVELSRRRYATAEFADVIYFGDGEWDYRTTADMGMRFVGVDAGRSGKLARLGARAVIHDFVDAAEILAWLENLV
ncbi:MAG: HAD family hydrolase [Blastocatellia bacterium]